MISISGKTSQVVQWLDENFISDKTLIVCEDSDKFHGYNDKSYLIINVNLFNIDLFVKTFELHKKNINRILFYNVYGEGFASKLEKRLRKKSKDFRVAFSYGQDKTKRVKVHVEEFDEAYDNLWKKEDSEDIERDSLDQSSLKPEQVNKIANMVNIINL